MSNSYSGTGGAGSPTVKTSADGGTVSGNTTITPDPTLNLVAGSGITLDGTSTNTLKISSSGGGGAVSITADNTGTTFVDATVTPSPITGTGTISADLNATGTTDATTFLRGDNTFTNVLSSDMSLGGSLRIGNTGAPIAPLHINSTVSRVGFLTSTVPNAYFEFFDSTTSGINYVNVGATGDNLTFKSNNVGYTWATADGAAGEVLTTDGSGNLSFSAASGGVAIGDTITGATQGSVLFAGAAGVLAQDNTNFFWDDTNNRLGIGTNSPSFNLDINGGTANTIGIFRSSDPTARINFRDNTTTSDTHVGIGAFGNNVYLYANNGIVLAGQSNGNISIINNLDINGNLNHDGNNIGFFATAPTTQQTATGYGATPTDPTSLGTLSGSADANFSDIEASIQSIVALLQAYGLSA